MIEKVNPSHPDKVADRIAGAIVDLVYNKNKQDKVAVEILVGHGICNVIVETKSELNHNEIESLVHRIGGDLKVYTIIEKQDAHLSKNQEDKVRTGDNGIFKGVPLTDEQVILSNIARNIYNTYKTDGKYILDKDKLIICQSNAKYEHLVQKYPKAIINPLGYWTGGTDVDTGAVNRKLGSDMGEGVTGGGLHGKDLSKADVSINIYAFLKAQETNEVVELSCAIGDEYVDGKPYEEIVKIAEEYINGLGGFEKFAEWGLF